MNSKFEKLLQRAIPILWWVTLLAIIELFNLMFVFTAVLSATGIFTPEIGQILSNLCTKYLTLFLIPLTAFTMIILYYPFRSQNKSTDECGCPGDADEPEQKATEN
jgi:hypothetical protein